MSDESGQAFPGLRTRLVTKYNTSFPVEETIYVDGLTKREWFAGMAMQAIIGIISPAAGMEKTTLNEVVAIQAYRMADAMLAASSTKVTKDE